MRRVSLAIHPRGALPVENSALHEYSLGARGRGGQVNRRVLVVEDETRIAEFLARGLTADGMTVEWARTGPDAVKSALHQRYDLVLLDLVLPQLNGLAVLERVQESKPDLPVIVVSARGDVQTKLRAFELGARDYVEKPFSFDELLARIRVHLVKPLSRASVMRAGRLELDLTTREARVGTSRALLSEREFRLLGYLIEHAGEAVSRERLLSEVWGYGFDPGSNVVDVCVRRIRRRLGDESPIETVRSVGYRVATD
jgi:two-component system, OmpR family, response regulator